MASLSIRMLHQSPTRSRLRAIGHCMPATLFLFIGILSSLALVTCIMQVTLGRSYHYASHSSTAAHLTLDLPVHLARERATSFKRAQQHTSQQHDAKDQSRIGRRT